MQNPVFVMVDAATGKRKVVLQCPADGHVELQTYLGGFPNAPVELTAEELRELARALGHAADALERKSGRFS